MVERWGYQPDSIQEADQVIHTGKRTNNLKQRDMNTLKEQIENRCIHFTGLGNIECKAGINYTEVVVKDSQPFKFPCLKNSTLTGGTCVFCEFPSEEVVNKEVEELEQKGKMTIQARITINNTIKATGEKVGNVVCPACNGILYFKQSDLNGHVWAHCCCGFGWIE